MNIKLGEKIRSLRKERNLSQEVLAQYLGVSFQSVSKWETGTSMPDVAMIPAIASFFEISTDELFDFNILEIEKRVDALCHEAARFRHTDPAKSEEMLRAALKQYPGNDIILNNLLYTMRSPERNPEVADLCKALIESTKHNDVRYDALRILAETYKTMGDTPCAEKPSPGSRRFIFQSCSLRIILKPEDCLRLRKRSCPWLWESWRS